MMFKSAEHPTMQEVGDCRVSSSVLFRVWQVQWLAPFGSVVLSITEARALAGMLTTCADKAAKQLAENSR